MKSPDADEAMTRWGGTAAYAESEMRTSTYTDEDWTKVKHEAETIAQDFAAALRAGDDGTAIG